MFLSLPVRCVQLPFTRTRPCVLVLFSQRSSSFTFPLLRGYLHRCVPTTKDTSPLLSVPLQGVSSPSSSMRSVPVSPSIPFSLPDHWPPLPSKFRPRSKEKLQPRRAYDGLTTLEENERGGEPWSDGPRSPRISVHPVPTRDGAPCIE